MLYVGVPFSSTISADGSSALIYDINMNIIGDSAFNTIKSAADLSTNPLPLSALNFLNRLEFGHFLHVANNAQDPTITYILSYFILANSGIDFTKLPTDSYNFPNAATFTLTD